MGLFVNTNISSLNAQSNMVGSTRRLQTSFQRLSSGLRVNSAADDAAGMAIGERFSSQIRGLSQAMRNANDAISLSQTAEGALRESTNILQRIRELAVQAASDVNTTSDRTAMNSEVTQLIDELERIGESTTFNQKKILDGSFLDQFFHIGMNFRENLRVRIRDARASTLGRVAVQTGAVVSTQALANGDVLLNGVSIRATNAADDSLSTSLPTASGVAKASAINDSTDYHGVTAYVSPTVRESVAAIQGGVLDTNNNIVINGRTILGFEVTPDDADDQLVRAINAESDITGVVAIKDQQGRIELRAQDGRNIEVIATGNAGDFTGLTDGVNNESVTLSQVTLTSDDQYQIDGVNADYIGFNPAQLVGVNTAQVLDKIDLTSRDNANLALLVVDRALSQVSQDRAQLGALQNRLQSTISNLTTVVEQATQARSRILDADFAVESASLSRNQILQQAATSILAQANSSSQQALSLIQG
ncbi:MAG: flagellin [Bradymonadia bacterium]